MKAKVSEGREGERARLSLLSSIAVKCSEGVFLILQESEGQVLIHNAN